MGLEPPENTDLAAQVDWRGEHGFGLGLIGEWDQPRRTGDINTYMLAHDTGEDDIGSRPLIGHDGETRGWARLRHREYLTDVLPGLEFSLFGGWVSDASVLEEMQSDLARKQEPWTTGFSLLHRRDHTQVELRAEAMLSRELGQTIPLLAPGHAQSRAELRATPCGQAFTGRRTVVDQPHQHGRHQSIPRT